MTLGGNITITAGSGTAGTTASGGSVTLKAGKAGNDD